MNTTFPNKNTITRKWHLIDAKDQVLGRIASSVAQILIGKGKAVYAPHVDCGDFVVIINAKQIKVKGAKKPTQKIDFRHSGYPGGDTMTPYSIFLKEKPERAVTLAVSGMLPKNKLRQILMTRLRVYSGDTHPHSAQFATPKEAVTTK